MVNTEGGPVVVESALSTSSPYLFFPCRLILPTLGYLGHLGIRPILKRLRFLPHLRRPQFLVFLRLVQRSDFSLVDWSGRSSVSLSPHVQLHSWAHQVAAQVPSPVSSQFRWDAWLGFPDGTNARNHQHNTLELVEGQQIKTTNNADPETVKTEKVRIEVQSTSYFTWLTEAI